MKKSGGRIGFAFLSVAALLFFSCASVPDANSGTDEYIPGEGEVININLPQQVSRSFFYSIDPSVLALAENGSPETLKATASFLHKARVEDYTSAESVLLYICAETMKLAWPEESFSWEYGEIPADNIYAGCIDSARRGIYDSSTDKSDFFTLVLPSLVLVTSGSRTDYFSEAQESLSKALEIKPDSVLANYLMGVLHYRMHEYKAAISFYDKALAGSAGNVQILKNRARSYNYTGRFSEALTQMEALLEKKPQDVELLMICSEASYGLKELEKTEDYVLRVLQLQPENLDYVLFRARILVDKGDYIRASSLLDVYSRSDQTSREYLMLRARMQKDWNKNNTICAETLAKALSLYPDDEELLVFAAEVASAANMMVSGRTALELSQTVLTINSENERALSVCIGELIKMNEISSAYQLSRSLMDRGNPAAKVVYDHVELCLSLGYKDEAWEIAQRLYSQDPQNEEVIQTYIKVLVGTNRRSQASEMIARLMPDANSKMKSFLYYMRSFFGADDEDVLSDLRASLTANPRNRDALYRLYQIYYGRKDWKRAQYYLKQVVALEPTNTAILQLNSELDVLLGK